MTKRADIVSRILAERERHFNLPGTEWDAKHTPSDWIALITHYVGEEVRRGKNVPAASDFEDSMVKAAAMIIAALEHTETMREAGDLS